MRIVNKQLIFNEKTFDESDIDFNVINELITKVVKGDILTEECTDDNSSSFLSLVVSEILDCNQEESRIEF